MTLEEALRHARLNGAIIRPVRCDCCVAIDDNGDLVKIVDGSDSEIILSIAFNDDWEIVK